MNIGIIGFGVVGSGVYEVIRKNKESIARKAGTEIDIKYILDIRDFSDHEESHLFVRTFDTILSDDSVEIVVETIGGLNPAYDFTKKALLKGKSVVTSNKELVATYGDELLKIAEENNCSYLFEASVGGGIPIIRPLNQCLAANEINAIVGIINGTTNYILTEMIKSGRSFEEALKNAQKLGYAEQNPSADVDGHDTCRKISILTSLATGKKIESSKVHTEGITKVSLLDVEYASKLGYVIKLVGMSKINEDGTAFVFVSPMMIPVSHPLAGVDGVNNAILVTGNAIGDAMFYGPGAGKLPTASAVVADVIDITKNNGGSRIMWKKDEKEPVRSFEEAELEYFVRLSGSYASVGQKLEALFGKCTIVDVCDGEFGFLTGSFSELKLKELLAEIPAEVIGCVRVLNGGK